MDQRVDPPFSARLCALVDARLGDYNLNVDELARSLNLSRRQLLRKTLAETGTTPSELLRSRRLEVAQALIERGTLEQVREVATRVGFRSKYFSRLYGATFGEPPRVALAHHRRKRAHSFAFPLAEFTTGVA